MIPTFFGSALMAGITFLLIAAWWISGESFLSTTHRLPAEVLVVEGWIGPAGVRSAFVEYRKYGYQYVVVTGGLSDQTWNDKRWSSAVEAEKQMLRLGVPHEQLILAVPEESETQRTYRGAEAVLAALAANKLHPNAVNVYTMGVHARRSRLVFAKVLGPDTKVGVVSWLPSAFDKENWRGSSERAVEFLKESVGYLFELLFNSGRRL